MASASGGRKEGETDGETSTDRAKSYGKEERTLDTGFFDPALEAGLAEAAREAGLTEALEAGLDALDTGLAVAATLDAGLAGAAFDAGLALDAGLA